VERSRAEFIGPFDLAEDVGLLQNQQGIVETITHPACPMARSMLVPWKFADTL